MKKLLDTAKEPKRVLGQNLDVQFNTSGSGIVDLVAFGADSFINKADRATVNRYVTLVNNAAEEDLKTTVKIGRYFRDREKGQGLKEQPLLMIACLDGRLSMKQIMDILSVFNNIEGQPKPGAVSLSTIDLTDLVKILAWHHYIHGRDKKLSLELCRVFASIIAMHKNSLEEVLRLKNREIPWTEDGNNQVSLIDIIGIVRGFKNPKIPVDVDKEYRIHLYPRHRGGQYYHIPTGTKKGEEWRNYFKGDLEKGYIPEGITFDKVLCTNRKEDIARMVEDGRISTTQLKLNINKLSTIVPLNKIAKLLSQRKVNFFPHELLAMAMAFCFGTEYTKKNSEALAITEELFRNMVSKYQMDTKRNVIVLGDTSGSMSVLLSPKSTIHRSNFSAFMSYFASLVTGYKVFGTWDSDARLYIADKGTIKEALDNLQMGSDANTDVYKTIVSIGEYFNRTKITAPEYICLISDMQFDYVVNYNKSKQSNSVTQALTKYKTLTGVDAKVIYWDVGASTCPATKDADGVLLISGFSAANTSLIFGIVETKESSLSAEDTANYIKTYYND